MCGAGNGNYLLLIKVNEGNKNKWLADREWLELRETTPPTNFYRFVLFLYCIKRQSTNCLRRRPLISFLRYFSIRFRQLASQRQIPSTSRTIWVTLGRSRAKSIPNFKKTISTLSQNRFVNNRMMYSVFSFFLSFNGAQAYLLWLWYPDKPTQAICVIHLAPNITQLFQNDFSMFSSPISRTADHFSCVFSSVCFSLRFRLLQKSGLRADMVCIYRVIYRNIFFSRSVVSHFCYRVDGEHAIYKYRLEMQRK